MHEFLMEMFGSFSRIIVFFHIVSAMMLVGSLFVLRYIVKPIIATLSNQEEKYEKSLRILSGFGKMIIPAMLILISSSVFMNVGLGFKYGNPTTYVMIHTKTALWTFIIFNFIYMYIKYRAAKKAFKEKEFIEVHENIILIVNYLVPLNLVLSLISAYFGVILRGF